MDKFGNNKKRNNMGGLGNKKDGVQKILNIHIDGWVINEYHRVETSKRRRGIRCVMIRIRSGDKYLNSNCRF